MTQQMIQDTINSWPIPHRLGLKALSSLTIDAQYAQHLGSKLFNSSKNQEGFYPDGFQEGCKLLRDTVMDLQKTASYLESVLGEHKG